MSLMSRALRCAFAVCLSWPVAVWAGAPPGLGAEIRALSKKVLADPGDKAAGEKLDLLRRQQGDRRRDAYTALTRGLEAYLRGDRAAAAAELKKAAGSPQVVEVADTLLLKPVREIIAECEKGGTPPAERGDLCPACAGTGWADCPAKSCYGSGTVICPTCKGRGTGRHKRYGMVKCPTCAGAGETRCRTCYGVGVVACKKCRGKGATGAGQFRVGTNAAEAIEKVLARVRYLRDGGLDLFSPDALACSPKLEP